jgi:hypothetical protein
VLAQRADLLQKKVKVKAQVERIGLPNHMTVMDENKSPVEVHLTKNWYCNFKGFAGVLHRERNLWFTELQGARSRTID